MLRPEPSLSGSGRKRRSDEVSELLCLHGSEGYAVRDDENACATRDIALG